MFLRYNISAICWAALIFFLYSISGDEISASNFGNLSGIDKFAHFLLFCVFGVVTIVGFKKQQVFLFLSKYAFAITLLLTITYGATLEVIQGVVFEKRSSDVLDFIANAIGALLSLPVFKLIYRGTYSTS